MWTAEELEAMRLADEEIEAEFRLTNDDLAFSLEMDRNAQLQAKDHQEIRVAAQQKAYREANREKYNAYMREYMKRKRAQRDGHPN